MSRRTTFVIALVLCLVSPYAAAAPPKQPPAAPEPLGVPYAAPRPHREKPGKAPTR